MIDGKHVRYRDLVECSARIIAFDGLIEGDTPNLVSALISEAIDLNEGWAQFSTNDKPGTVELPVVDAVIADVFHRAEALKSELLCHMRCRDHLKQTHMSAATSPINAECQKVDDIARQMRRRLAVLRQKRLRSSLSEDEYRDRFSDCA
jgi:hypothetical protein